MSELHDHELSGLLDGELDTSRAKAVRLRIAANRELSEELEALTELDAHLRKTGEGTAFLPRVSFPSDPMDGAASWNSVTGALGVTGVLLVRFMPKADGITAFGLALSLVALLVISVMAMRMARDTQPTPSTLA